MIQGVSMLRDTIETVKQHLSNVMKGGQRKINAAMLPTVMNKVIKAHEKKTDTYRPPFSETVFILNPAISKQVFAKDFDSAESRDKVFSIFSAVISPLMSFLQGGHIAKSEREIYKKHFKSDKMKMMLLDRSKHFFNDCSGKTSAFVDLEAHCIKTVNDFVGDILFGTKAVDIKAYQTLSEKLDEVLSQTPVALENPHLVKEVKEHFGALNLSFLKYDDGQAVKTPFLKDIEKWYKELTHQNPEIGQFSASDLSPVGRITALGNIMKSSAYILFQLASNRPLKDRLTKAIDCQEVETLKAYVERSMLYYMVTPALARHATADIQFEDLTIKKNSLLLVPMRAIARMQLKASFNKAKSQDASLASYTLEEWIFDLDRELPADIKLYKYPFTPFGLGARKCPAASGFTVLFLMVLTSLYAKSTLRLDNSDMVTSYIDVPDNSMANPIPAVTIQISTDDYDKNLEKTLTKITDKFFR
jgi:hypothetical protein